MTRHRHAAKQISILSIILLSVFLKYKQYGTFGSFQVEVNDAVWLILLRRCRITEIYERGTQTYKWKHVLWKIIRNEKEKTDVSLF